MTPTTTELHTDLAVFLRTDEALLRGALRGNCSRRSSSGWGCTGGRCIDAGVGCGRRWNGTRPNVCESSWSRDQEREGYVDQPSKLDRASERFAAIVEPLLALGVPNEGGLGPA